MPRSLVVAAHPDPGAFTRAWAGASVAAAGALGPVRQTRLPEDVAPTSAGDPGWAGPDLPADVAAEVDKLLTSDRIILHFPLWWFGPPGILKDWCDRALAHGPIHSSGRRFDRGRLAGTKVLFCVTTGATEAESGPDGCEGETRLLLWPLAQTFRYCGATVLEPRIVHGVHAFLEGAAEGALRKRLGAVLDGQVEVFAEWDSLPHWPMNRDGDFDEAGRLKPDAPSHSPFIRRV